MDENKYISIEPADTLSGLATHVGAKDVDHVCLWPTEKTKDHGYPNNIWVGDSYDTKNLQTAAPGATSLNISLSSDRTNFAATSSTTAQLLDSIKSTSNEGGTPLSSLIVEGHSGGGNMGGAYVIQQDGSYIWVGLNPAFNVNQYTTFIGKNEFSPTFARAKAQKGPARCWFSRDATVRFAGCHSDTLADGFAKIALRPGAHAYGTQYYVGLSPTGITYGASYKMVNGRPEWDGVTYTSNDPWVAAAWSSYNGGL